MQKIVFEEIFGDTVSSYIQTHPTNSSVFTVTSDDQLALCRFDWEKGESSVFGKTGLPGSIGCLSYNTDGTRINCALRSGFYSMDSEVITRGIDKRVFSDPITSIASFNLNNQSYNLVLGDESGNLHLIDTREATTVKDRMYKTRTEGVSVVSIAVDEKIAYLACENGVVEAFDLKKRSFIMDYEFNEKILTYLFMDDKVPVVSTDEGEVIWLDVRQGRVLHKTSGSDLIIDRITPISDEYALVKSISDNLKVLSIVDHKFVGEGPNESAVDVASTCGNEQIVVGFERNGHLDVEVWDTKNFLQMHTARANRSNGHVDNGFFSGLSGDE